MGSRLWQYLLVPNVLVELRDGFENDLDTRRNILVGYETHSCDGVEEICWIHSRCTHDYWRVDPFFNPAIKKVEQVKYGSKQQVCSTVD